MVNEEVINNSKEENLFNLEEETKKLLGLDVNEHTELKSNLTYLSWAWAWAEALKSDPRANYEIQMFDGKPYYSDEMGIMVFVDITMFGIKRTMWLPVMDFRNKAMKIDQATMFDVNKTIMRCLVKGLAMFGIGLYIYAGEDLPEDTGEICSPNQVARMKALGVKEEGVCRKFNVSKLEDLTSAQARFVISAKEKALSK